MAPVVDFSTSGGARRALAYFVVLLLSSAVAAFLLGMNGRLAVVGGTQLRQREQSGKPLAARLVPNANQAFLHEELREAAIDFAMLRKQDYDDFGMGLNWRLRGIGFLYTQKQMLLAAQVHPSGKSVHVFDVLSTDDEARIPRDDCDKLSLWVRVYGPEVYAGTAQTVPATETSDCFWKFDFEPVPGEYAVDARLLLWNAKGRDYEAEQACKSYGKGGDVPRDFLEKLYPVHAGFKGFKFYVPAESCCEACNRLSPHCKFWTSPPAKMKEPSFLNNGCELYFDKSYPESEVPKSWIMGDLVLNGTLIHDGPNRRLQVESMYGHAPEGLAPQHFLGCGWSFWHTLDFPCLSGEKDDQVFMLNDTFEVLGTAPLDSTSLPLCEPSIELMDVSNGRWVQEPFDSCPLPYESDANFSDHYPVHKYDGRYPRCWHRDDISVIGNYCIEMNCRFIDDSRIWNSRARVSNWNGVWRERSCDYLEFTDDQLQQCITSKKITAVHVEGMSIAGFLSVLINQRLSTLTLYPASPDEDTSVVHVSTLGLLHHSDNTDAQFREYLSSEPNATKQNPYYYMSAYYTSSEREPYATLERVRTLSRIMDEVLPKKGYVPMNAFDPSAAWTFDTATQRDGMHVTGPPQRAVVTKFFHYLCKDVVEGGRV